MSELLNHSLKTVYTLLSLFTLQNGIEQYISTVYELGHILFY